MKDARNQRTIGASILAILTAQVGVLALMLSGSVFLQSISDVYNMAWGAKGLMMLLLGLAYLVLAYALWVLRSWTRLYSYLTLVITLVAAIINTLENKILDLGFVLVFFMCCSLNFCIIAWFLLPDVRQQFLK
jgi:hypothetical protein